MRAPVTVRNTLFIVGIISGVIGGASQSAMAGGQGDGPNDAPPCGDPNAGDCFLAHPTPGCNNEGCCEGICFQSPDCCTLSWDSACAALATTACPGTQLADLIVNPGTGRMYKVYSPTFWLVGADVQVIPQLSLPSARTGEENEFLRRFLGNSIPGAGSGDIWIGANDRDNEGTFVWLSGDPFSFTRWAPGQPDNHEDEDFASLSAATGAWSDQNVGAVRRVAIEFSIPECGSDQSCFAPHAAPGCSPEHCCHTVCLMDAACCAVSWDSGCVAAASAFCEPEVILGPMIDPATRHAYYALTTTTWYEAERFALTMGGHLAVPNDLAEQTWLFVNFVQPAGGVTSPFLGIHDQLAESNFQSLDVVGSGTIGFTRWAAGAPNPTFTDNDVVAMGAGGFWSDVFRFSLHPAIVEVPCVGDLNGSGAIDAADLAILLGDWGVHPGAHDLNIDGTVDAADLAILLGGWGPCDASSCCSVHAGGGCDQKGCTICVCSFDPFCCQVMWDANCTSAAANECSVACQCGG